jgi:MFS family permease
MDSEHSRKTQAARRALLLSVYVPTALLSLAEGILLPTLPVYALQFDVSYAMASLVLAAAGIGTLLADVPAGMLLGRLGLKPTMLLGAAMVVFGTFMIGLAGSVELIIVYRLIAGVGTALWGLSRHAFITESIDPRQRGRAISVFGGINRIGMFGGPAIGGLIGTTLGLEASFFVAAGLGMLGFIVSYFYVKDTRVVVHTERHVRWGLVRNLIRTNWRDLGAASVAVEQVGLIQTASSSIDMMLFIPAGYLMDHFGRKVAAVPSFAIMGLGMVLIPFTTSFLTLMGAAMLIGLGNGLGSGTMMTLGADLAPPGATGEFLGLWRLIGDSGRAVGPLAVGGLTDSLGFEYTAYFLAGVGLGAALILAVLVKETRVAEAHST